MRIAQPETTSPNHEYRPFELDENHNKHIRAKSPSTRRTELDHQQFNTLRPQHNLPCVFPSTSDKFTIVRSLGPIRCLYKRLVALLISKHPRKLYKMPRGSSGGSRSSGGSSGSGYLRPDPYCDYCRGRGTYTANVTEESPCSTCSGSGSVTTSVPCTCYKGKTGPGRNAPKCPRCRGSQTLASSSPCNRCAGLGVRRRTVSKQVKCDCAGYY
ncbi:hypothetical protein B0J18DRAFT_441279 [Chaetomium sp. MPI-SDFR-AT-0129]|nr:hypothetical protein B0J18DRAFT_441279 [Chaetomium sp. MPI-SDFR-AT-0129]